MPLKSAPSSSKKRPTGPSQIPCCSPKSMYRLAASVSNSIFTTPSILMYVWQLGDERMKELALRAIKDGLSNDNIVEEALSWFTAQ